MSSVTGAVILADPSWEAGSAINAGSAVGSDTSGSYPVNVGKYAAIAKSYPNNVRSYCAAGDAYCNDGAGQGGETSQAAILIHTSEPATYKDDMSSFLVGLV